jgi:hypothetical protein
MDILNARRKKIPVILLVLSALNADNMLQKKIQAKKKIVGRAVNVNREYQSMDNE